MSLAQRALYAQYSHRTHRHRGGKTHAKATKEYLNYLYQHIVSSIFKHYAHIASTMRQTYRGKDTTFWEIFRFLKSNISLDLLFFGCSFCNFWLLANIFLFLQNN
jgi:hypothetical protein